MRPLRRLTAFAGSVALLAAVALAPSSSAAVGEEFNATAPTQTAGLPDLNRLDPVRFPYDSAVVEHYQVPTRKNPPTCMPAVSIATCPDTIWIDVIRPDTQEKVPAIMMSSPYYNTLGRGYKGQCKTPHQSPPGGLPGSPGAPGLSECANAQTPFPEWYDEYFVPRGYAFVAMDLRGTRNSTGCQTYGDRDEVIDAVDVVDFIAELDWSNGKVGMTGGSYDGTIANGAAAEAPISGKHPEALAAIIPIRAIDAWYDYHFFNGVQSSGHAATPALFTAALAGVDTQNSGTDDILYPVHVAERKACIATLGAIVDAGYARPYADADDVFWSERDFVKDAAGFKAATLIVHGLFDFNVKPHNAGYLWSALPASLPKRMLFLNTDHTDPRCESTDACTASGHNMPVPIPDKFVELNHRWWLQFLKGVEAGALRTSVEVQQRNGSFAASSAYPVPGTTLVLALGPEGTLVPPAGADEPATVTYADGPAPIGTPTSVSFFTAPFTKDTRLSGMVDFNLMASTLGPDTSIGVSIADLGPEAADDETASEGAVVAAEPGDAVTITYAWLRAFYRSSVKAGPERNIPKGGAPMSPNAMTPLSFSSMHTDYVVPKGHRVRVRFSNSAGGTIAANLGQVVTLATGAGSTITLPIAGAAAAAAPAPPPAPRPAVPPAPAPAPRPMPLPATGGGLPPIALAIAATAGLGALAVRRRLT